MNDMRLLCQWIVRDFREGTEYLFRFRYLMIKRFLRFSVKISGGIIHDNNSVIL